MSLDKETMDFINRVNLAKAAPDLLTALENMVAHFPFWASKLEMKQIDRDAVALARAAIAKARGE